MTRSLSVLLLALGLTPAWSVEIRVKVDPPEAGDSMVPVYEWQVEWALRDDKEPSLGSLTEYKTFAAAMADARKKQASVKDLQKNGNDKDWTAIKYIQVRGKPQMTYLGNLPPRPGRTWKAILEGLDGKTDRCNFLVRDIGAAAGAKGLKDRTADQLWGYFNTTADRDGWVRVTDKDGKSAIERANQLAADGHLVVGVISSQDLNKGKPKGSDKVYHHGHVFVVAPGSGADWPTTLIANAGTGGLESARIIPADTRVVTTWQRPLYQFYAVPISTK